MKRQMIIVLGLAIIGSFLYGGNLAFAGLKDQLAVHNYGSIGYNPLPTAPSLVVNEETPTQPTWEVVKRISLVEAPRDGKISIKEIFDPARIETENAIVYSSENKVTVYRVEIQNLNRVYPLEFRVGNTHGEVKAGSRYASDLYLTGSIEIELSKKPYRFVDRGCCFGLFPTSEKFKYIGQGTMTICKQS